MKKLEQNSFILQLPLLFSYVGFLIPIMVFSVVKGLHLWAGLSLWFECIIWLGMCILMGLSFKQWMGSKQYFRLSVFWPFYILGIFLTSFLLTFVLIYFVQKNLDTSKISFTEKTNNSLIVKTQQWKSGVFWTEQQCSLAQKEEMDFVNSLIKSSSLPLPYEINLLFSIEQTKYQAGCEPQWNNLILHLNKNDWNAPTQQYKRYLYYLQKSIPKFPQGCQMERLRYKVHQDPLMDSSFELVCTYPFQEWKPGYATEEALKIKSRLGNLNQLGQK